MEGGNKEREGGPIREEERGKNRGIRKKYGRNEGNEEGQGSKKGKERGNNMVLGNIKMKGEKIKKIIVKVSRVCDVK